MTRLFYPLILILVLLYSCKDNPRKASKIEERNSVTNLMNQEVLIDAINKFIDRKMKEMNVPGLSLAIINDGQVVYHTVKGYADIEKNRLNALFLLDRNKKWGLVQFNNADAVYDFGYDLFEYLHQGN